MTAQPCFIRQPRGRRGDHKIGGLRETGHGHIGLDPAVRIQELRIDDPPHRHRHIGTADMVQEAFGVAPFHTQLAERRHIIHPNPGADRAVLGGGVFKPVLALPRIGIGAVLTGIGEPVGALPSRKLAHHRAMFQKLGVKRRAPHTARGGLLAIGEVIGVKQPQRFF